MSSFVYVMGGNVQHESNKNKLLSNYENYLVITYIYITCASTFQCLFDWVRLQSVEK